MIEVLLFTFIAIVVYLLSDWILRAIEARRGETLKQRQVVFFAIFFVLIMLSFQIMNAIPKPG